MAKYKCSVCGYIYDEEKEGQPLLDSKCPVCGMTMVLMEENDSEAAASTALEADADPEALAYDPAYARCDANCRYMDDIHEMAVKVSRSSVRWVRRCRCRAGMISCCWVIS